MTDLNESKPIKICCVAPKAYPIFNPQIGDYFGGAEVDLYYLATELAKDNNFKVSFIVADYGQQDTEVREAVTIIKTLDFKKNTLYGLTSVWQGLKKADAQIYLLKTASPGTPLVALFCKLNNRVFVYRTAHTYECDGTYIRRHPMLGRAFAWSLRQAKMLFVQNSVDAQNLSATLGLDAHVVPNGHRIPQLAQKTRNTILWVGRDADFKKPQRFLDMAKLMPAEHFTMICQTLTHNNAYDELKENAAKLQNLTFISHVPFDRVDEYYQRAKVFVNTSDAEGFPNTFIQACHCATAILSFNANPDNFLNEYSCGLCCSGNQQRLSEGLKFMLEKNRYVELGLNARKYVEEKHDVAKIAEEYKKFFSQLV